MSQLQLICVEGIPLSDPCSECGLLTHAVCELCSKDTPKNAFCLGCRIVKKDVIGVGEYISFCPFRTRKTQLDEKLTKCWERCHRRIGGSVVGNAGRCDPVVAEKNVRGVKWRDIALKDVKRMIGKSTRWNVGDGKSSNQRVIDSSTRNVHGK